MIAEALGPGGGFSGKIEYLYDGKLEERQTADKKAQIITHSNNLRVPHSASDKTTRKLLKDDFKEQTKNHLNYSPKQKYVGEHVLSFSKSNMKNLTDEKVKNIVNEYISLTKIKDTQYIAVSHSDTDNFHVHIVFNRAMNDGTKFKPWKEKNKAIETAIALSLKHGLEISGKQRKIAKNKEVALIYSKIVNLDNLRKKEPLLNEARNLLHLQKLCESKQQHFNNNVVSDKILVGVNEFKTHELNAIFMQNRDNSYKKNIEERHNRKQLNQFSSSIMKGANNYVKNFEKLMLTPINELNFETPADTSDRKSVV